LSGAPRAGVCLRWRVARRLAPRRPTVPYRAVPIAALATVCTRALTIVHYSFTVRAHVQFAFDQHNKSTKKVLVFSISLYKRGQFALLCPNRNKVISLKS